MTRAQKRILQHIENLNSLDFDTSCRAEGSLIRYYGSRALAPLIEACKHPNPTVRFRAVWALGQTRDPGAFETIVKLTEDPDERVRYDARIALGIHGDERALAILKSACLSNDDLGASFMGLRHFGLRSLPVLTKLMICDSPEIRWSVMQSLGNLAKETGNAQCVELLKNMVNDVAECVRKDAADWLEEISHSDHADRRIASP